jgi:hypothetical protein
MEDGTPVPEGKADGGVSENEKITEEGIAEGSSLSAAVKKECQDGVL